ncbi:MAG: prepilin-type N-terminal cleavage/methylation domain-containing protein [Candidatus Methylomirabilis sp.]|nr:prepilin-type N-terminal cleavage/methylation domain-containing protein [Deltaproteobacteria bacterium]
MQETRDIMTRPHDTRRGRDGFTLIETMVVVAVIGLFTAIAVPNLQGWNDRARIRRGTQDVAGVLQLARLKAVQGSADVYVDFGLGAGPSDRFVTAFRDADGDGNYDSGEELDDDIPMPAALGSRAGVRLPQGVFFGPAAGVTTDASGAAIPADGVDFSGQNRVRFRRNGTADAGAVFVMNGRGHQYAVEVGAAGSIRTRRRAGGAWK